MTNKNTGITPLFVLFIAATCWFSCNKPTPFGADLLDDQLADYRVMDTTTVRYFLEREDSLITSDLLFTTPYFLCGELNDPVFGKSSSEINALFRIGSSEPKFKSSVFKFDSMVLFLRYAPAGVYGDTTQPVNVAVYQLNTDIKPQKAYYSTQNITATRKIAEVLNLVPRPSKADSLFFARSKAPYLRMRLDDNFAKDIIGLDSAGLATDTAFYRKTKGLKFKVTNATNSTPGCMLAFDLNDDATDGSYYSFMRVFYREDTIKKVYDYFFARANKFSHFTHDYTGSVVGPLIGKELSDVLYLQGMAGLRLRAEFPYARFLENIAINKAFFEMTVAPQDNPTLRPASQLATLEYSNASDTLQIFSPDVLFSLNSTGDFSRFGGNPVEETINGKKEKRYKMNIVQRYQDYVDATTADPKKNRIFIAVQPPTRSAMRSVINGPKNALNPAIMRLTYTNVK